MATAAYKAFVPHPPGYPLFLWLQAAFIHTLNFGSVYWRAALLSLTLSTTSLYFLGSLLKGHKDVAVGLMLLLASSRVFWKYSLLPDVFALNVFLSSLILFLFLKDDGKSKAVFWVPFLFFLGLSHHLTIVFLAPVLACVFFEKRRSSLLWASTFLGIVASTTLYYSLLFLKTSDINSWGALNGFEDIIRHFLRTDYGTFSLVNSTEKSNRLEIWEFFSKDTLVSFLPAIALSLFFLFRGQRLASSERQRGWVLSTCLILYPVVFFGLSNTNLTGFRNDIIERFFIFFQVVLVFGIGFLFKIKIATIGRRWRYFFSLSVVVYALLQFHIYRNINNFSKNTIVEDYALTLLREAPLTPTVLLTGSDTRFFALRYVQQALEVRQDVKVLAPRMLFLPWYAEKVVRDTGLRLNTGEIIRTQNLNLDTDLILPNLDRFSFLSTFAFKGLEDYHIKYFPLGRLLAPGKGISFEGTFDQVKKLRTSAKMIQTPTDTYDLYRELWLDYCEFPLVLSNVTAGMGNPGTAIKILRETIFEIPWCLPAARRLCEIQKSVPSDDFFKCPDLVDKIQERYYPYWRL